LEEKVTKVAACKPGPQARFIIDKMSQEEKNIQEILTRLVSQLSSIEQKVDSNATGLEKVQEKVDLAMNSISAVQEEQEEQVQVALQLKVVSGTPGTSASEGIMGSIPSIASSPTVGQRPPPPPPPPPPQSDRQGRSAQVNYVPPNRNIVHEVAHVEVDHGERWRQWMPKMDFLHFVGSDARIWLEKCSTYFALY
jgi:hypothetical protein